MVTASLTLSAADRMTLERLFVHDGCGGRSVRDRVTTMERVTPRAWLEPLARAGCIVLRPCQAMSDTFAGPSWDCELTATGRREVETARPAEGGGEWEVPTKPLPETLRAQALLAAARRAARAQAAPPPPWPSTANVPEPDRRALERLFVSSHAGWMNQQMHVVTTSRFTSEDLLRRLAAQDLLTFQPAAQAPPRPGERAWECVLSGRGRHLLTVLRCRHKDEGRDVLLLPPNPCTAVPSFRVQQVRLADGLLSLSTRQTRDLVALFVVFRDRGPFIFREELVTMYSEEAQRFARLHRERLVAYRSIPSYGGDGIRACRGRLSLDGLDALQRTLEIEAVSW